MILARAAVVLAGAFALAGCLSLPEPPPATARSQVGDPAPVFSLARTGASPGKLSLDELWRSSAAVIVFYRGAW